jgi:hypothetical protein
MIMVWASKSATSMELEYPSIGAVDPLKKSARRVRSAHDNIIAVHPEQTRDMTQKRQLMPFKFKGHVYLFVKNVPLPNLILLLERTDSKTNAVSNA